MNIQNSESPINRVEPLEIKILRSGVRHYFGENDLFRGKKIKIIDSLVLDLTYTEKANAVIPEALVKKCFVTFVSKGKEAINRLPLIALIPSQNNGRRLLFDDIEIDFAKSYIEFSETTSVAENVGKAIPFSFYFNE